MIKIPGGCSVTGCEPLATFPIGQLPLASFPFSGRTPDQIVSAIPGARPTVPVLGRPATYFRTDPATGGLLTGVIPLPVDTQCQQDAPRLLTSTEKGQP